MRWCSVSSKSNQSAVMLLTAFRQQYKSVMVAHTHYFRCPKPFFWRPIRPPGTPYRLSTLPDDPARRCGSHLDVRLQLDFLLGAKEVLLLQFAIDPALSLTAGREGSRLEQKNVGSPIKRRWTLPTASQRILSTQSARNHDWCSVP